ncbi:MAG: helix-turn-helix domain-containing protein [Acidobacteriota bacterium]|nr:helix-turn-helix domain-containing protein [Acidobacteriota bacterium]
MESITIESLINHHINRRLDERLPDAVSEQLKRVIPPPVWMTERQLADYWQLRTPDGEVTVHSIRKWTARPVGEHPLPCASMGEMRRYHREEVDRWAREEAVRQRGKRHHEMEMVGKQAG